MSLTAFNSRLGTGQGRLEDPSSSTGEHVFVLGDLNEGHFAELAVGDHAEIRQNADFSAVDILRVNLQFSVPKSTPSSFAWKVAILIDGTRVATTTTRPGRSRMVTDFGASVSKLTGVHQVGVRLELIASEARP